MFYPCVTLFGTLDRTFGSYGLSFGFALVFLTFYFALTLVP